MTFTSRKTSIAQNVCRTILQISVTVKSVNPSTCSIKFQMSTWWSSIVVCQCLTWYLLVQSWVTLNRQTGHIMKHWWYVPPIKILVKNNHKFTIKISEHLHTHCEVSNHTGLTVVNSRCTRQQLMNCSQYFSYLSHDIRCGCLKPSLKCWNLTTVFKWQGLECTDVVTWFFKKCLNHRLTPS